MKSHRILFVNHAAVLGGGEISLLDLATAYRTNSEVLLFCDGPFREQLEKAGVKVKILPAPKAILSVRTSSQIEALQSIPNLFWMAFQLLKAAKGFDVIHANSQKAFIIAALARFMGSPPVLWHLRDILTAGHFSKLNRRIAVNLANQFASRVLVNSQATANAFITSGGSSQLVNVLYNGFSIEHFYPIKPEKSKQIRDELGIGNAPLVGMFSRLSYWKGQHILLEALRELPEVHAIFVGKALFEEGDYVSKLNSLAAAPELVGRIHWLGFRHDVPILMKACNIIVHASTEPEPFGRVIIEGMLAEKPVIASASGGAVELIQDGITGCLIPPDNSAILAMTIRQLLNKPAMTDALAKQGFAYAKANFSLEKHLKNFEQVLTAV